MYPNFSTISLHQSHSCVHVRWYSHCNYHWTCNFPAQNTSPIINRQLVRSPAASTVSLVGMPAVFRIRESPENCHLDARQQWQKHVRHFRTCSVQRSSSTSLFAAVAKVCLRKHEPLSPTRFRTSSCSHRECLASGLLSPPHVEAEAVAALMKTRSMHDGPLVLPTTPQRISHAHAMVRGTTRTLRAQSAGQLIP